MPMFRSRGIAEYDLWPPLCRQDAASPASVLDVDATQAHGVTAFGLGQVDAGNSRGCDLLARA